MTAFTKAQSLGLTGTDAEQVAILQTLTVSDIATDAVAAWLQQHDLWYLTGPDTMAGILQQIVDSPTTPDNIKAGLGKFYSAVFGRGASALRTTDPDVAVLVWSIMAGLASINPALASLQDSFYALDGGRPYKDLTVEEFATQRTAAEQSAAAASQRQNLEHVADDAYQKFVAQYNAAKVGIAGGTLTTEEQVVAVIRGE